MRSSDKRSITAVAGRDLIVYAFCIASFWTVSNGPAKEVHRKRSTTTKTYRSGNPNERLQIPVVHSQNNRGQINRYLKRLQFRRRASGRYEEQSHPQQQTTIKHRSQRDTIRTARRAKERDQQSFEKETQIKPDSNRRPVLSVSVFPLSCPNAERVVRPPFTGSRRLHGQCVRHGRNVIHQSQYRKCS
ncbi:hypothetical protein BJ546DRAFT_143584 [Cryomyces antarcticus]